MAALGVAVAVELLLQREHRGEGVLPHRLAVAAGGVAEHRLPVQHPGRDVGVGPGEIELQQPQALRRPEICRRDAAEDHVRLFHPLRRRLLRRAIDEAAARPRALKRFFMPLLDRQRDQYRFHRSTLPNLM